MSNLAYPVLFFYPIFVTNLLSYHNFTPQKYFLSSFMIINSSMAQKIQYSDSTVKNNLNLSDSDKLTNADKFFRVFLTSYTLF